MYNTVDDLSPTGEASATLRARVGTYIRERREHLGKNQTEVADAVGLSQSAYQKIESGVTSLSITRAVQICHALGAMFLEDAPRKGMLAPLSNGDQPGEELTPNRLGGSVVEDTSRDQRGEVLTRHLLNEIVAGVFKANRKRNPYSTAGFSVQT